MATLGTTHAATPIKNPLPGSMTSAVEHKKLSAARPITVLHLISNMMSGGAEAMLSRIVSRSTEEHVRHVVVSMLSGGIFADQLAAQGIRIHSLGARRSWTAIRIIPSFIQLVRAIKPDLIQAWMYHANLMASLTTPFLSFPPVLWNVRQTLPSIRLESATAQAAIVGCVPLSCHPRVIVYNSAQAACDHEAIGYAAKRRLVIPNGFDLEKFKPNPEAHASLRRSLSLQEDALIVGRVARFHPMKDFDTLFKAFERIAAAERRAHLVIVGRGVNDCVPEISTLLHSSSVSDRIHLLGERADTDRITAGFDIALSSSSRGEAFPNVIGEAMACGVPVAATDVGESAAIVNDPTRIARPGDIPTLAECALKILALSPQVRAELGARDRARIMTTFSVDHVAALYTDLWRSAVTSQKLHAN